MKEIMALYIALSQAQKWEGVDKGVIEKFAAAAGREPSGWNSWAAEGDLPLFLFLVAGVAGGFVFGYFYRELFPPRKKERAGDA